MSKIVLVSVSSLLTGHSVHQQRKKREKNTWEGERERERGMGYGRKKKRNIVCVYDRQKMRRESERGRKKDIVMREGKKRENKGEKE